MTRRRLHQLERRHEYLLRAGRATERVALALRCPQCAAPHIDRDSVPHLKHWCEFCSFAWEPYPFPTVGVDVRR